MRYNVMLEPQEGLTYAEILAVAQRAESLGFEGCYRADHYKSVAGRDERGSTDAWATLAGLARETERIVLGTMVSPATFRPAGNLAKVVATVAEMAGTVDGAPRIHLGLGAGWLEEEHRQHGFPFESLDARFRRLEEHLAVVRGLFDPAAAPFDFDGEFERLEGATMLPHPDPRPRIIVGGRGLRRTPRLAATYADELNVVFTSPEETAQRARALATACERAGREPGSVTLSLMTGCLVGADEDDFRRRAERLKAISGDGRPFEEWLADLEGAWVLGTPERAAARLGELAEVGVERIMLQHQLPDELDMLDVVAEEVAPRTG